MNDFMTDETKTGNIVLGYCDGCLKINKDFKCTIYQNPTMRCRLGCSFSPKAMEKYNPKQNEKRRLGQQKQKKKK